MANVSSAPAFPKDLDRVVNALRLKPACWMVADEYNHRLWHLQPNSEPQSLVPTAQSEGQFHYPASITRLADEIFVVDSWNHRIVVFDCEGNLLRTFGHYGNEPDAFACPEGISANRHGDLLIADTQNDRVKICLPDGTLKQVIEKKAFELDESGTGQTPTALGSGVLNPRQVYCAETSDDFVLKTHEQLLLVQEGQCVAAITCEDFVMMHLVHFDGDRAVLFHEQRRELTAYHWDRPITYTLSKAQAGELTATITGESCIWFGPEGEREVTLEFPQTQLSPVDLMQEQGHYIRFSANIYQRQQQSQSPSKQTWASFQRLLDTIRQHKDPLRKPTSASLATSFPHHQPLPNYLFEASGLLIKTQWEHELAILWAQLQQQSESDIWQSFSQAGSQAVLELFAEMLRKGDEFTQPHRDLNRDVALTLLLRLLARITPREAAPRSVSTPELVTQVLQQASDLELPVEPVHGLKQQATHLSQHLIAAASMDFSTPQSQSEKAARAIVSYYRTLWYQHLKQGADVERNYIIGGSLYHLFPLCYALGFTELDRTTIAAFSQQPLIETDTARTYIASHLVHLGEIDKAIQIQEEEARQITKHNPKPTLVSLYTRFGQKDKAEALLAEMKGDDHLKAKVAYSIYTDACQAQLEELLQEAEKHPDKTWVHHWIGYLFVFSGRFSDGLAWLENNSERTQGGFFDDYRALCAWFSGQPEKAKNYFETSAKRNFKVELMLASFHRAHGDFALAREALARFRCVLPSWFADLHDMLCDLAAGDEGAFQSKRQQLPSCAHVFDNQRWLGANQNAFEQQLRTFLDFEKQLTQTKGQAAQGKANLLRNYCFMLTNNVFLPV